MPDWSIKIAPAGNSATFPPVEGHEGDDVSWNNATTKPHWPWPTDQNYKPKQVNNKSPLYLSDEIAAGKSSDAYSLIMPKDNVDPQTGIGTVYYYCKKHPDDPQERGTIKVKPVEQAPVAPPPTD